MRALDRMLLRDLWGMRGQVLAIVLVIAAGTATVIMALSTLDTLRLTRDRYYRDYAFAEVFASLKRAPQTVAARIAEIPGVARVQTRVAAPVTVEIEGFDEPVTGRLLSVPDRGPWLLNRLYLRAGRLVESGRGDEVLVSEVFAQSHGLQPGDRISVIVNGRRKALHVVGLALSPEYVYQIAPGTVFPDFERFGVLWMARTAVEAAYDMEGAFNDVVLGLAPGAGEQAVIERLDALLERYGGLGAYGRADQTSHRFLDEDLRQLDQMGRVFSGIFLAVSAFLLNMVMGRLVGTQREQIAALKAFGYGNLDVGLHYLKMVSLVVALGLAAGLAGGLWLGHAESELYMEYYRFPTLHYELRPAVVIGAGLVTLAAALAGTFVVVRRAAVAPPAQAMRPEPPPVYRATLVERAGLQRWLSQPTRMILRHLERRPLKAAMSVVGIAFAGAIMIIGTFFMDAVDFMVEVEFGLASREDLSVTFVEPVARRAVHEIRSLPGVERVEPYRAVPVRLRHGHRSYRTSILGFAPGADLRRPLDADLRPVALPPEGLVLTDHLGTVLLGAGPGDTVTVEVLEGNRAVRRVPVAGLVHQFIGVSGYMDLDALNRLLREGPVVSGVSVAADEARRPAVYAALRGRPGVAGTEVHDNAVRNYYESMGEVLLIFVSFIAGLAGIVTFGVVYNAARITLSERSRELASLRVLGFTRGEIAYVLLGELALLTVAAIPLGFLFGRGLALFFVSRLQQDLFRIPLVLEPGTYALAAAVVAGAALVSGLIVRRRLDRLDLIAVLKTKE